MSVLGRRLEANPDWSKSDRKLATAGPILALADVMIDVLGAAAHGGTNALLVTLAVNGVYAAVVLAALWSGLPVVAKPAPEPKESAYRPGPRVAAIEPPKPSLTFMQVVLGMVVGGHILVAVAAVAFGVLALVVLGLLWVVCSKH